MNLTRPATLSGVVLATALFLGAQKCPPPNPNPSPTPTPSPSPTASPTPTPTPSSSPPPPSPSPSPALGCTLPALDDLGHPEAWHPQPPSLPFLTSSVNDAAATLTGCEVGVDPCRVGADRQTVQANVIRLLQQKGFCAGQDSATADQINIARTCSGIWETYHVVADVPTGGTRIVWARVPSAPCAGDTCAGSGSYRGNVLIDPQWCSSQAPPTPLPSSPPPTPGPSPTPSPTATPVPPPSGKCPLKVDDNHFIKVIVSPFGGGWYTESTQLCVNSLPNDMVPPLGHCGTKCCFIGVIDVPPAYATCDDELFKGPPDWTGATPDPKQPYNALATGGPITACGHVKNCKDNSGNPIVCCGGPQ